MQHRTPPPYAGRVRAILRFFEYARPVGRTQGSLNAHTVASAVCKACTSHSRRFGRSFPLRCPDTAHQSPSFVPDAKQWNKCGLEVTLLTCYLPDPGRWYFSKTHAATPRDLKPEVRRIDRLCLMHGPEQRMIGIILRVMYPNALAQPSTSCETRTITNVR